MLGFLWTNHDGEAGTLRLTHTVKRIKDRNKTSDHKTRLVLSTYADFHLAVGHARSTIRRGERTDSGNEDVTTQIRERRNEVWAALVLLWHVGSEEVVSIAGKLLRLIDTVMDDGERLDLDQWKALIHEYTSAVRRDLLEGASESRARLPS